MDAQRRWTWKRLRPHAAVPALTGTSTCDGCDAEGEGAYGHHEDVSGALFATHLPTLARNVSTDWGVVERAIPFVHRMSRPGAAVPSVPATPSSSLPQEKGPPKMAGLGRACVPA